MTVVGLREVSGRTFSHRFGESPTAELKFVVTLDNTAPTVFEVSNVLGIFHGQPHPEFPYLRMVDAQIVEGTPTPLHAEVTYRYEVIKPDERDPNPLARPDTWQFSTGGAAVPALVYYDGTQQKPLVNSAFDYFEGLTTEESECRATISANRAVFPLATAIAVTNTVNASSYLGGAAHTWKCSGISGQQVSEVVNDQEINYWAITSELVYRQSGWNLLLPDIGYHYLDGSTKKRAFVISDGVEVPSAEKVALNSDGSLKASGTLPDILTRRVNREVNFATYFGTPSWF
jgi:hypothetical protein